MGEAVLDKADCADADSSARRPQQDHQHLDRRPLDPVRLRTAFGIFPTGAVAVAAEVDGGSCLSVAAAAFGPASTVGVEFARYNCACIGTDVACVTPVSDGVHLTIRWSWHERTGGRAAAGSTGLRRLTGAG